MATTWCLITELNDVPAASGVRLASTARSASFDQPDQPGPGDMVVFCAASSGGLSNRQGVPYGRGTIRTTTQLEDAYEISVSGTSWRSRTEIDRCRSEPLPADRHGLHRISDAEFQRAIRAAEIKPASTPMPANSHERGLREKERPVRRAGPGPEERQVIRESSRGSDWRPGRGKDWNR